MALIEVYGSAGLLPGIESTVDVSYRGEAHLLRNLGRKRRASPQVAIKNEFLPAGENVLVVDGIGINPEFQHPARAMKRIRTIVSERYLTGKALMA